MNVKKIAVAVSACFLVACGPNSGIVKNADLTPDTDSIRPKPVSTVFHRPEGAMVITFDKKGNFLEITSKASAPIAGNNAFSVEQAATVAQMRAKRNIAEFISTQLNTTRSVKILSTTVQKSLENTTNGMAQEVVINDHDFDANGDPIVGTSNVDGGAVTQPLNGTAVYKDPNTNSEKIAQIVRENITTNASALLRGVMITDEKIIAEGRTIEVEVKTGTMTINAANQLRKLMGSN